MCLNLMGFLYGWWKNCQAQVCRLCLKERWFNTVDPATKEFDQHLERNDHGFIQGKTKLGKYMCQSLHFDIRRTDLYWKIQHLYETQSRLEELFLEHRLNGDEKDFYIVEHHVKKVHTRRIWKRWVRAVIINQVYHQCGSVTETIRVLGYPTRRSLYTWIENEGIPKPPRKELTHVNTAGHSRNPSFEVKMDALHRCFELGESIKSVSEEIGYTRVSIYAWRKKYLRGGTAALKNDKIYHRTPWKRETLRHQPMRSNSSMHKCRICRWRLTYWKKPSMS